MVFNRITLISLIVISTECFSQNNAHVEVRDVTKVTLLNPGITYEKKIGRFQSLYTQAFLSTAINLGYSSTLGNTSSINFYPALALQYRYYYNGAKRAAKGKRTEMNSLNYISAKVETNFFKESASSNGEKELRALKIFGAVWGLQRNYPKRFSLDLNLGLGYVYTKETTVNNVGEPISKNVGKLTTLAQVGLGFWLNKRN